MSKQSSTKVAASPLKTLNDTLLYPMMPNGLGTNQAESITSYFSRLSTAHHVTNKRLFVYLDELQGLKHQADYYQGAMSRLQFDGGALIATLVEATGRVEVAMCNFGALSKIINLYRCLNWNRPRHCPICVTEERFPHAWSRFLWEIQWVDSCPRHGVLLVDSSCGRPPNERLLREQFCHVGACRRCGSIAHGCRMDLSCSASDLQNWVAHEVGELIAAATGGEAFSLETLRRGVRALGRVEGSSQAKILRSLGLGKGYFQLACASTGLNLRVLVAASALAGVRPISVLRGDPKPSDVTFTEAIQVPRRIRRPSQSGADIKPKLTAILEANPTISFTQLASRIGVRSQPLRCLFPDLAREMTARNQKEIGRQKWLRLLRLGRKLRLLQAQLEEKGFLLTKPQAYRHCGVVIHNNESPEGRLLKWVRQRSNAKRIVTLTPRANGDFEQKLTNR